MLLKFIYYKYKYNFTKELCCETLVDQKNYSKICNQKTKLLKKRFIVHLKLNRNHC